MLTVEHARVARELQNRAAPGFYNDAQIDRMVASELLWGAVTHGIMAIATERGWPKNSHGAFRNTIKRLGDEYDDPALVTFFDSAEKLHENFYHNNLNAREMARRREQAERLIPRLLAYLT